MTTPVKTTAVLATALLVSYAYFYQAGGWNQNSRFALVRAILEHGSIQIDPYHDHTGDRALYEGHYYSDKAPGASFLAVVPTAAARAVARVVGVDPESLAGIAWTSYVATVATAGVFTMLAALAVFWLSLRWGASRNAALFAATAYGLATPAWCYATLFMGHAVTAGCLMIAFSAAVGLEGHNGVRARLGWIVGLFGGLAVLSEFPAAVPVLLLATFAVWTAYRVDRRATIPVALRIAIAGGLVAVVLGAYQAAAFGSPLHLGYSSEDSPEGIGMQQGLFGITYPTLHVAYEVLLGSYRGLLPLAPLMVLAPIGLFLLARTPDHRRGAVVAALVAAFYLFLNLSYRYWEGGWAYAPRHLTPGLPFLALGLAALWDAWPRIGRIALTVGWIWGAALTLVAVSTTPQPPSDDMSPVTHLLWPAFREGDLSLNPQTFVDYGADPARLRHNRQAHASWNLGEVMHLEGLGSLAPLGLVWLTAAWGLRSRDHIPR
jgi:hypothetical protein